MQKSFCDICESELVSSDCSWKKIEIHLSYTSRGSSLENSYDICSKCMISVKKVLNVQ